MANKLSIQRRINSIKNKILKKEINLNSPITLKDIMFYEKKYKIEFPEEYREFLINIGNGGDGPPFYKINDLVTSIELSQSFAKENNKFLLEEFPLNNYLVWEDVELAEEDMCKLERIHSGNLIIGEDGCGIYWMLIITGAERGQMWQLTEVGAQPCAPKLSFLDWYEYWLEGGEDWWREFKY